MPTFIYTAPNGRKIKVSGDTAPTPQQLEQIFANAGVLDTPEQQAPSAPLAPPTWADKIGLNEPTASPALGFMRGSGAAVTDMAEGAASGLMNTAFKGGDLIRKSLGIERVIDTPEAQQAMRAPDSFAGNMGRFIEQGAEFAAPLSKISKSAAALSWVPRMAVEGAAGAGVAGVQSGGDPAAMTLGAVAPAVGSALWKGGAATVNAVRNAAAGASEEGIGAAIANLTRSVVPVEPKSALIQALKPRNTRINFARELGVAMPELKASEEAIGRPIESIDDLLTASKAAKKRIWAQYERLAGPHRAMGARVDLSGVADAIENSIPKRTQLMDPGRAMSIKKMADAYRSGTFSLDDAEVLLREANADLEAYYNKFPAARGKALATNPETANTVAEVEALRKAIYAKLDAAGEGNAAAELKRRYGALLEIEDAATRRANVAARQQPESLSEQIGKVRSAAEMARGLVRLKSFDIGGLADMAGARAGAEAAKYLKEQQTTDALIRRAFAGFKGRPTEIPMPPPTRIAGELPPATWRMGPKPDTSGGQSVRGEWAQPGIRPGQKALPPPSFRPMPAHNPGTYTSESRTVAADWIDQVDPRTGEIRRIYLSDGKK